MTEPLRPYYIPVKPKQCDQIWDEMTPTEKGRICAKCEKHIYDFENMKWNEILDIHQNSKAPVCGNYNQKQIKYWGREIPKWYEPYAKYLISLGIVKLFLSNEPLIANNNADSTFQTQQINQDQIPKENIKTDTSLVIKGEVIHYKTYEPIYNATIHLVGSDYSVNTNIEGKFELSINIQQLENANLNKLTLYIIYEGRHILVDFSEKNFKKNMNIYTFDETLVFDINESYYEANNGDSAFYARRKEKSLFKDLYYNIKSLFIRKPFNQK
ncbi:MAG: hypothetical protein NTW25_07280 [Candidatus Kapabacteria bacterium]|nr:hypothetical protein [Candidatus Kapabacteria bacterium]